MTSLRLPPSDCRELLRRSAKYRTETEEAIRDRILDRYEIDLATLRRGRPLSTRECTRCHRFYSTGDAQAIPVCPTCDAGLQSAIELMEPALANLFGVVAVGSMPHHHLDLDEDLELLRDRGAVATSNAADWRDEEPTLVDVYPTCDTEPPDAEGA